MADLLEDRTNLLLLQEICAREWSRSEPDAVVETPEEAQKHDQRDRVRSLLSHKVIDRPVVPFLGLFRERPLLVVVYADLPEDARVSKWIKEDMNIFGAYRVREGDYNIMLSEFHGVSGVIMFGEILLSLMARYLQDEEEPHLTLCTFQTDS